MRELFVNLEVEQKENLYQQLYKYIEDDNLDAMQDILKYKINLTYKLKNFTSEDKGYLEDYLTSPLGMALQKDRKILKELLINCYIENLELHGPVYLYLAAKMGDEGCIFFAQQLVEFFVKNNVKLNLDFMINEQVFDLDVIGTKDFIAIAIENNQELFIDWVLSDKFIESQIFVIKIHHIQNAIKNLAANILKKLLLKSKISLTTLIEKLENKFLYITTDISYIEYLAQFDSNLYKSISEILFIKAVSQNNLQAILWLLKKGFFFECNNTFYMMNVLNDLQRKYPEEQLSFIAMYYKNYGLAQFLLQFNKMSVESLMQYHIQNDCNINVKLFESIYNHLNRFLLSKNDSKIWIDLFKSADISLYYRLFKLLTTFKQEYFTEVVQNMFQHNANFIVLQAFFEVIENRDYNMLNNFLLLPEEYKEFLLNGDHKQTALSIACENKYIEILKTLLQHMNIVQINKTLYKNNYYKNITALWLAIAFQFSEGVECLLDVPNIDMDSGKGEHYKFKNNVSVSCKELYLLSKLDEQPQMLNFYTSGHSSSCSNSQQQSLLIGNQLPSSSIELDQTDGTIKSESHLNILEENNIDPNLNESSNNARLNCSI